MTHTLLFVLMPSLSLATCFRAELQRHCHTLATLYFTPKTLTQTAAPQDTLIKKSCFKAPLKVVGMASLCFQWQRTHEQKLLFNGPNALMLSNALCCHKADTGIHILSVMQLIFNMFFVLYWQIDMSKKKKNYVRSFTQSSSFLLQDHVPPSESDHNKKGVMLQSPTLTLS